jgi:molecular chaperone DnaK (HSP70)
MSGAAWTLCIDFGTAYSKAAAAPSQSWSKFEPARIRPLMLGSAERNAFLLESAVFVDDRRVLFGAAANAHAGALADRKRLALRSFKTLLSVSDLDRALNTAPVASIDPHRVFVMRDLIVLYLAFLGAAVERGLRNDTQLARETEFEWRYAAPAWRRGDVGLHGHVMRLFGEAAALRDKLDVMHPDGVGIEQARAALAETRANAQPAEMALIFEATAAAAYTLIGLKAEAPAMIVLDMGAGTTDIAVLARAGARTEELRDAQTTLTQAGDFLDRVIANLAVDAARLRNQAQQADLWRAIMGRMRDFKETLFAEGRASFRDGVKPITLSLKDFARSKDFRSFEAALVDAYDAALETARGYAVLDGGREIQAVAVGGGAAAPFIQQIIRRKPRGAGRVSVTPKPATPDWAHAKEFQGNLAPVFPQLAIAIGGAIAPREMLAAGA